MSRLVKIVNNKYVQIEEYKNPNICFNTNEYDNFEDYCTLRETFDPFEIFYENQELKEQVSKGLYNTCLPYSTGYNKAIKDRETQQKEFIKYMNDIIKELESEDVDDEELRGYMIQRIYTFKEILQKYKEIIGGKE